MDHTCCLVVLGSLVQDSAHAMAPRSPAPKKVLATDLKRAVGRKQAVWKILQLIAGCLQVPEVLRWARSYVPSIHTRKS